MQETVGYPVGTVPASKPQQTCPCGQSAFFVHSRTVPLQAVFAGWQANVGAPVTQHACARSTA